MILGAQIAVFACLLAGKKKRIWLHTVYGDGIKTGILAYDWLLLAVNAVWERAWNGSLEPWREQQFWQWR